MLRMQVWGILKRRLLRGDLGKVLELQQEIFTVTKKEQKGALKERPNRKSIKSGYLKDYL